MRYRGSPGTAEIIAAVLIGDTLFWAIQQIGKALG